MRKFKNIILAGAMATTLTACGGGGAGGGAGAVQDFIEKDLCITNFSYFLTEKNYSQKVPNKKVLVIDEAHNLENELTRFIEISVSSYFSDKILKTKIPKDIKTQFKSFKWIKEVYLPKVTSKINFFSSQMAKFGITSSKLDDFKKVTKQFEMLTSHEKKIKQFIKLYDKDNWVFDIENTGNNNFKLVIEGELSLNILNKFLSLDVIREGSTLRMVKYEIVENYLSKK